jgi:hypothetical protein
MIAMILEPEIEIDQMKMRDICDHLMHLGTRQL